MNLGIGRFWFRVAIGAMSMLGIIPATAWAQLPDSPLQKVRVGHLGAAFHYGSIFAHSEAVQNTAGANPIGVELQYTRQRRDKGGYDLCQCYPRQGITLAWYNYDTEVLGYGLMAGWSLEPTYRLGARTQLHLRGLAGIAWLSNPYHPEKNPTNQSYSSALSGWLLVGLGTSYPINPHWRLYAYGNFQHISNGGQKQPNKGINWPTASLQVTYSPTPKPFYQGIRSTEKYWRGRPWRKDVGLYAAAQRTMNADGGSDRTLVAGSMAQASKQVGRINALTVGAEGTYYAPYTDSITRGLWRAGIIGGHEFLLGQFIFSQQLGVYVYNPSPHMDGWYHRWGLVYRLSPHLRLGFNLKAHLQVAEFTDVRLVYSWP